MKKLLLLLACLFACDIAYTQITFERHYNCVGYNGGSDVLQTDDGGYLIAAHYLYLIKTDQYGDTLWTKGLSDGLGQSFFSLKKTNDNCFIACGSSYGFGLYGYNYWLAKFNANGDTIWQKGYGGYGDEDALDVIQTSDNGYALVGASTSFNDAMYFVKTDSYGDTLWTKVYKNSDYFIGSALLQLDDSGYIILGHASQDIHLIRTNQFGDTLWTKIIGGSGLDEGYSIQKTNDNGFIIFGYTLSYGAGQKDVYAVKINSNGDIQWSKTYGGPGYETGCHGIVCNDGGFAIACMKGDINAGVTCDSYLIRTNSIGDTLWTRTFTNAGDDWFRRIQETSDGGFILTGYIKIGNDYNVYLVKTNANGQVLGIDDYSSLMNSLVSVYPNPTTGQANIQTPKQFKQTKTLEIFNCTGQLQLTKTGNFSSIDLSSLPSGLYFIVLTNSDNEKITSKIIKE